MQLSGPPCSVLREVCIVNVLGYTREKEFHTVDFPHIFRLQLKQVGERCILAEGKIRSKIYEFAVCNALCRTILEITNNGWSQGLYGWSHLSEKSVHGLFPIQDCVRTCKETGMVCQYNARSTSKGWYDKLCIEFLICYSMSLNETKWNVFAKYWKCISRERSVWTVLGLQPATSLGRYPRHINWLLQW